ncbi:MAG: hypothetical protein HKN12_05745 [Gemmatimonadetes bacterium]|nr:hypothetical protein [Gemmatimonadota bacterium]
MASEETGGRPAVSWRLVVGASVVLAFLLRIAWPLADPATRFSWSNGIYTDPTTMVHAARNATLFGEWILDYNRDLWIYPLMNGVTWLAYQGFGVGRFASQFLSALFGALTVVGLAWGLRRTSGPRAAVIGAVLGAVNFWMVMFARIPVAENLVVCLLTFAAVAAVGRSPRAQFLAGAIGVAATLFGKYHAVGFLPAIVLLPWLRDRSVRAVLPVLAGGTSVFLLWLFAIFLPQQGDVLGHVERQSSGHGALPFMVSIREGIGEIYNTLRRSWMFYRLPIEGALGSLFALWVVGNGDARRKRTGDGSAVYAFWFLGMWLYYSLLLYKAPRYYVLLGPPLVAGAAVILADLSRASTFKLRVPMKWDEHVPLFVWLYSFSFGAIDTVKQYASMILEYLTAPPARISDAAFNASVDIFRNFDTFYQNLAWAAVFSIVGYVVILWNPEIFGRVGLKSVSAGAMRRIGQGLMGLALFFAVYQYGWWAFHRTPFLEDVKESFPAMIAEDAVLLGPMAPLLVQDTELRVHPYYGPPGHPEILAEYGVTHVAICGPGEAEVFEERFPGLLDQTDVVQVWPVTTLFSSTLELRRLPRQFDGRILHAYEPTAWEMGAQAAGRQDWNEALKWFERHREAGGPEMPELLSLESVCWFKLEDYGRAEEMLREAIRRRPLDPLNFQNLGVLHLRRGERAEALDALIQALKLNRDSPELKRMITELTR